MKVPQYVKLMKDGKYEFCSDHPIDDGKTVAVFDCKHSEKPLHESALCKKPTRTEYVKAESCDWNVWEYLKAYNDGEVDWFFKMDDGNYTKLVNWFDVANRLNAGKCEFYRRIEKPVDWRDEIKQDFAVWFDNGKVGLKMNFSEENFLEMCRVALRANGELPTA